jgi:hypothetical protein
MQRGSTEMEETASPIRFTARERSEPAEGGGGAVAKASRGGQRPPFSRQRVYVEPEDR